MVERPNVGVADVVEPNSRCFKPYFYRMKNAFDKINADIGLVPDERSTLTYDIRYYYAERNRGIQYLLFR